MIVHVLMNYLFAVAISPLVTTVLCSALPEEVAQ